MKIKTRPYRNDNTRIHVDIRFMNPCNENDEIRRRLTLPEFKDRAVRMRVRKDPTRWVFEISDDGDGFDWRRFLDFDPERAFAPNGRGIALSRQLSFSSLTYIPPGNRVVVTVPRDEASK